MKSRGHHCWICHNGEEFTYLFEQESPGTEEESSDASPGPSAGTGALDAPLYALEGIADLP